MQLGETLSHNKKTVGGLGMKLSSRASLGLIPSTRKKKKVLYSRQRNQEAKPVPASRHLPARGFKHWEEDVTRALEQNHITLCQSNVLRIQTPPATCTGVGKMLVIRLHTCQTQMCNLLPIMQHEKCLPMDSQGSRGSKD